MRFLKDLVFKHVLKGSLEEGASRLPRLPKNARTTLLGIAEILAALANGVRMVLDESARTEFDAGVTAALLLDGWRSIMVREQKQHEKDEVEKTKE